MMRVFRNTYLIASCFFLLMFSVTAQENSNCVDEIIALEKKIFAKDYSNATQTIHISYAIKSTDWAGKYVTSNVKIYRNKLKLNFFSEQANMYQDENNVVMVLKPQKVLMVNAAPKNIPSNYSDEFVQIRMEFLKSAEVVKCETSSVDKNIRVLELKSNIKLGGELKVDRMIYTYNSATGKILKTTTYYDKGFQVKKIEITYKLLDFNNSYKFLKTAKKYVFGKNNQLISKYSGYEFIDNTKVNE